jgi:hypothetical protein
VSDLMTVFRIDPACLHRGVDVGEPSGRGYNQRMKSVQSIESQPPWSECVMRRELAYAALSLCLGVFVLAVALFARPETPGRFLMLGIGAMTMISGLVWMIRFKKAT